LSPPPPSDETFLGTAAIPGVTTTFRKPPPPLPPAGRFLFYGILKKKMHGTLVPEIIDGTFSIILWKVKLCIPTIELMAESIKRLLCVLKNTIIE